MCIIVWRLSSETARIFVWIMGNDGIFCVYIFTVWRSMFYINSLELLFTRCSPMFCTCHKSPVPLKRRFPVGVAYWTGMFVIGYISYVLHVVPISRCNQTLLDISLHQPPLPSVLLFTFARSTTSFPRCVCCIIVMSSTYVLPINFSSFFRWGCTDSIWFSDSSLPLRPRGSEELLNRIEPIHLHRKIEKNWLASHMY